MSFLERVKTKPGYKYLAIIILISGITHLLKVSDPAYQIKNNENLHLICRFKDGYREVPKEKIVSLQDDTWIFTNGYSHNCEIQDDNKSF